MRVLVVIAPSNRTSPEIAAAKYTQSHNTAFRIHSNPQFKLNSVTTAILCDNFRRHRISDSAYCDRWSVRLSVCLLHSCTLLKPLYGIRCHLAGTLMCIRRGLRSGGLPTGMGDLGSKPPTAAISQPPRTLNIFTSIR